MFTQHAAEAENADNAAEQKRQMNKRVRYGEIVQVLSNKWKHEENTIQVVSFTLKKKLGYITCRTCKCVLYKSYVSFTCKWFSTYITIFVTCHFDMLPNYLQFCLNWKTKLFAKQILVNIDIFTQTNVLRVRITRIAIYSLVYLVLF